jgi:integrase
MRSIGMNDTRKKSVVKPAKPYPEFPLFPHDTGRWAKKVRGRLVYFGPWGDPQAALNKWLDQRDDLMAGRRPQAATGQITVRDVVNTFLTSKENAMKEKALAERTFRDYDATCERILNTFGKQRAASNLGPRDFADYWETMKGWAPVTKSNEVQRVRSVFKYAFEATLIEKPVNFGPDFKKPSAKTIRADKASKPVRIFDREHILTLLKLANVQMKAMILFGINCGLGNTDISDLNVDHLDFPASILDFPRPKTSVERRAIMWPETVKAALEAIAYGREVLTVGEGKGKTRYRPTAPADTSAVFLTLQQRRFVRQDLKTNRDSVAMAFGKLLRAAGIKRDGINFYSLRHTFETVAGGAKDQAAVDRVMGHQESHIRATYTHWRKDADEDARLRAVAEHVRGWLHGVKRR